MNFTCHRSVIISIIYILSLLVLHKIVKQTSPETRKIFQQFTFLLCVDHIIVLKKYGPLSALIINNESCYCDYGNFIAFLSYNNHVK